MGWFMLRLGVGVGVVEVGARGIVYLSPFLLLSVSFPFTCFSTALKSALMVGLLMMALARLPNRRVESVSTTLYVLGEHVMTMQVLALPPSDSERMRVSLQSRKGICAA